MFKSLSAPLSILTLAMISTPVLANSASIQSTITQEYAQAGTTTPSPTPRSERKRGDVFEQLNLTDTQKQQISSIRQKYRPNMDQTSERLRTSQQELQQLMASNAPRDRILSKYQQVSNLRQDMERMRFQSMLDIRDVLTTAQRQQLDQMMDKRRSRMRDQNDRPQSQPSNPM